MNSLNKKAINSMKWLVVVGIFSSASSFLTSVFLGRISNELLGQYSLVISFLNLTTSIVCMGGSVVLSRYIIRENDVVRKTRIFMTYVYCTILIWGGLVGALYAFPELYVLFIGKTTGYVKVLGVFGVMPLFSVVSILAYFLNAVLEAKISKLIGSLYTIGMCVMSGFFFFAAPDRLERYFIQIVFAVVIVMNILALIIGISHIAKKGLMKIEKASFSPLIYSGMITIMLCTMGQSLLIYLNTNAAKVFLAQLNGVGQLGSYQAVLQIVAVVELIPHLLGNVTIPYFSSLIGEADIAPERVRHAYQTIENEVILFIASMVFGLIAISDFVLQIFGEGYINYKDALLIMLAGKIWSSRGNMNTPMLVNLDKNVIRFGNSVIQVGLQLVLMFILIPRIGIYGAVIATVGANVLAQWIPQRVIKKSKYQVGVSRQYIVASILVTVLITVVNLAQLNAPCTFLLAVLLYVAFFYGAGYTIRGVIKMIELMLER